MASLRLAKSAHDAGHTLLSDCQASETDPIGAILQCYHTLAVVGLSSNTVRPSYGVSAYMQSRGYRVVPVNPNETSVLGERAYPSLGEVPEAVDVVVIFRRPEHVPKIVENSIRAGAKAIWMQEGITHEAAARMARRAGLLVVQDRCILKEHARRYLTDDL